MAQRRIRVPSHRHRHRHRRNHKDRDRDRTCISTVRARADGDEFEGIEGRLRPLGGLSRVADDLHVDVVVCVLYKKDTSTEREREVPKASR
jgi:hypothetical protein